MKRSFLIGGIVLAAGLAMAPQAAATVSEFQPIVEFNGRAVAVTVSPVNTDHAIVASESGGLFKTINHGVNWSHIDTLPMFRMRDVKYGRPLPGGGLLVIATGWPDSRVGNLGGIWRSLDGGATWSKPAGSNPGCVGFTGAWGISSDSIGGVYVGTDCGLAISRDDGATWSHLSPNPPGDPRIFGVVTHDPSGLGGWVVDICGAAGHMRSTDSGGTFSPVTAGSRAGESVHCIAVSPVESSVVFLAVQSTTPFGGCGAAARRTVLEGDYDASGNVTWTQVVPTFCRGGGRSSWVATNPSRDGNPDHFDIYFGTGLEVWRQTVTKKGGSGPRCSNVGWTLVDVDHADQNGMAFSTAGNCAQFMVSDGGVHGPTDVNDPANCGAKWSRFFYNNGYNALQLYQVTGQMRSVPERTDLYIGTQDNRLWASDNGGSTWPYPHIYVQYKFNEGFHIQVPRYALFGFGKTATWAQPVAQPNRTGPAHFEGFVPFIVNSDWRSPLGLPIIDNPTLTTRSAFGFEPIVYVQNHFASPTATQRTLAVTTDEGVTWNDVLTHPIGLASWSEVSVAGSDVTLYQAYTSGVLTNGDPRTGLLKITGIRTDGTVSAFGVKLYKADVSGLGSLGGFCLGEGTFVCQVVFGVDPNDPSHLIAPDAETGQMKFSLDGGDIWTVDTQLTDLVTGLNPTTGLREFRFNIPGNEYSSFSGTAPGGNFQVHVIAFDPFHKGHILVGTEAAGIFRSTDNGTTWTAISDSRKVTGISSIFFVDEFKSSADPVPHAVIATYGRGLWKARFPPPFLGQDPPPFNLPPAVVDSWRTNCWLRYPTGGCILPEDLFDTNRCPSCLYHAVVDGNLTGLTLTQTGVVQAITIDGGRVVASTEDGLPVWPYLPVQTSTNVGSFTGCPECANLVQQGGAVKGVVLEDGRLKAIIGGFGPLPGEDALRQFSPAPPTPAPTPEITAPTGPHLRLFGTIAVGSQPTALGGDTVTAIGSGFCADAACSPVTLSIGGHVLAALAVDASGSFQTNFPVVESPGDYTVTATQQTPLGQLLRAVAQLAVPVGEAEDLGGPPRLVIRSDANGLSLAWSGLAYGYAVEWTTNLAGANSWQPYPGPVVRVEEENVVFVQPAGTQSFFRLRR